MQGYSEEDEAYGKNKLTNWKVIEAKGQFMEVKLTFSNSLLISGNAKKCEVLVEFK